MEIQPLLIVVSIVNFNVKTLYRLLIWQLLLIQKIKWMVDICNRMDLVRVFVETIYQFLEMKNVMIILIKVFAKNVKSPVISIVYNVIMDIGLIVFQVINGISYYNNVLKFVEIMNWQIKKICVKMEIINQKMNATNANSIVNNHVLYALQMDAQNVILKDGYQISQKTDVKLFVVMELLYNIMKNVMIQQIKIVFSVNKIVKILAQFMTKGIVYNAKKDGLSHQINDVTHFSEILKLLVMNSVMKFNNE
ncbi:unnamed protein product [Paramecium sonneborni]|uniref:Transmembrane protein n=1 Tax=Paramecium sonneborni TaxID=65129 RepID=A0A8S1Q091_9CILI|nr:unnamed protein product [Paramecium sonneborni]